MLVEHKSRTQKLFFSDNLLSLTSPKIFFSFHFVSESLLFVTALNFTHTAAKLIFALARNRRTSTCSDQLTCGMAPPKCWRWCSWHWHWHQPSSERVCSNYASLGLGRVHRLKGSPVHPRTQSQISKVSVIESV